MIGKEKLFALLLILILIVNAVLFAAKVTGTFIFWAVVAIVALITYLFFSRKKIYK